MHCRSEHSAPGYGATKLAFHTRENNFSKIAGDTSAGLGSLGAGLFAPLFTGGALEAQVELATADQEAAIAVYGQSLLKAFEEVETSLTNERLFAEREDYLHSAEDNSKKAYDMSRSRFDVGQTDLLSVLQVQAQWVGARVGLVNIKSDRLIQRVNLHLALGGSFETAGE